MRTPSLTPSLFTALVAALLPACGGAVGEAIRPQDHNATNALSAGNGPVRCSGDARYAKPLIVDLDADTRVDLEAAMKEGLVVVSYDCASLRVLSGCKLPDAAYEYAGVSRKEQVVQIKNADDLSVNLPLSSAKMSGELTSGRTIDLALVLVGRRSTTVDQVDRGALVGACDGATHYLQSGTLGAFSMQTGSVGKVAGVAEMFNRGGSAASASERKSMSSDGSLDACRTSNPDAESPPTECRAPLRVELVPIAAKTEAKTKKPTEKEKEAAKKEGQVAKNPCPPGYSFTDGICTKATSGAHVCNPKNEVECKEQCDLGSLESCYNYGIVLVLSSRRPQSVAVFKKACDGEFTDACAQLGWEMADPDQEHKDRAKVNAAAVKMTLEACSMGSASGCWNAGYLLTEEAYLVTDKAAGLKAYDRGCSLGLGISCWSLAQIYLNGNGVAKDPKMAISLLQKACLGGNADECHELATWLGKGVSGSFPPDPDGAFKYSKRACEMDASWCNESVQSALTVGKNQDGFTFAKRACDAQDTEGCSALGELYEAGTGTAQDVGKAMEAFTKGCDNGKGTPLACKRIGIKREN